METVKIEFEYGQLPRGNWALIPLAILLDSDGLYFNVTLFKWTFTLAFLRKK